MPRSQCSTATARPTPRAGGTGHFVDAVVELIVGDNAHVRYLSVQEHGPHTWQVALQRAHLGRDASLKSSVVALGGSYARLRSESLLAGSGAESDLTAVYFGDGHQMLDFRTLQDHDAPNTRSDLLFKGAVEDTAQSVYSGLIRIRPDAEKSVAFQTNRNLVLTEGAEARSVPNLEIEADDVKCSHASTVGPIDDDQLYYLATRGVPPDEAERLIVLGFFDDVFDRLPVRSLVAPLRRSVVEKIEHRDAIARAGALTSACAPSTTSPPVLRRASTSTATASAWSTSKARSTSSATSARTTTTRSPRATCGRTSARSSARATAPPSRWSTAHPRASPPPAPSPSTRSGSTATT